ncbi:amino acid ABC transporter permease [Ochrobactrum sp. BTU1]|uniref:amino acid ABC transporter permease n=1 Tax=Ochrobactrum sp. BTU1 TaxID=2840456 RepID=UPI001C053A79|nr:amino acid ABC transporter permease [Ochrobactrum sp. BTU1]
MTGLKTEQRATDRIDQEQLRIVPLRHTWRWLAVAVVLALVAAIIKSAVSNPEFQWPVVAHYLLNPLILNGLRTTILLTIVVMILATIGGTIAALMMMSPSKLLSVPAATFVWFFRGTPALVQLILWYNLSIVVKEVTVWLPWVGTLYSVSTNDIMTPLVSATVALSLHESGYMAEIVRSGLKSVSKGQYEASACLGMKPGMALRRIILPQAMRMIIPPTGNETINLLKTTSLVSIIAVSDLLYSAQSIYARTFETIPLLLVVSFWYLAVVSIMSVGQFYLERHFSRDEHRNTGGVAATILGNLTKLRRKEALA